MRRGAVWRNERNNECSSSPGARLGVSASCQQCCRPARNVSIHEKEEECGLAGHVGLAFAQVRILVLLPRLEPTVSITQGLAEQIRRLQV